MVESSDMLSDKVMEAIDGLVHDSSENGYMLIPVRTSDGIPVCKLKSNFTADYRVSAAIRANTTTFAIKPQHGVIVIDVDIPIPEVAEVIRDWFTDNFPEAIFRDCNHPKFAVILRGENAEIGNAHSAVYYRHNIKSPWVQIEVAANLKLVTVVGKHRKTNRPYRLSKPLRTTPVTELPEITAPRINELFDILDKLMDGYADQVTHVSRRLEAAKRPIYSIDADGTGDVVIDPAKIMTDAEVYEVLKQVDGTARQDWIRVGYALHYNYGGSRKGLTIWDRWSRQFHTYEEGSCIKEWSNLKPSGELTMKTFQYQVNKHNRETVSRNFRETLVSIPRRENQSPDAKPNSSEVREIIPGVPYVDPEEIDKECAQEDNARRDELIESLTPSKTILASSDVQTTMLSRYVYVSMLNAVVDRARPKSVIPFVGFERSLKGVKIQVGTNKNGDPIIKDAVGVWVNSPDKVVVKSTIKIPKQGGSRIVEWDGESYWNTYEAPEYDPTVMDKRYVDLFLYHMRYLFGNQGPKAFEWVMNWFAHLIQYPEVRPTTCVFHISQNTGTGRGYLNELMRKLLGDSNHASISIDKMLDKTGKNGWLADGLFVSVSEMEQSDNYHSKKMEEQLKDLIDVKATNVDRKWGAEGMTPIYCRLFLSSNNIMALPLDKTNRRVSCYQCEKPPLVAEYYDQMYMLLESKRFLASVYNYLNSYKVNRMLVNRVMRTSVTDDIVVNSMNMTERLVHVIDDAFGNGSYWEELKARQSNPSKRRKGVKGLDRMLAPIIDLQKFTRSISSRVTNNGVITEKLRKEVESAVVRSENMSVVNVSSGRRLIVHRDFQKGQLNQYPDYLLEELTKVNRNLVNNIHHRIFGGKQDNPLED